jgi:hypothetical protein
VSKVTPNPSLKRSASPGLASCRCRPLSSNVRPHSRLHCTLYRLCHFRCQPYFSSPRQWLRGRLAMSCSIAARMRGQLSRDYVHGRHIPDRPMTVGQQPLNEGFIGKFSLVATKRATRTHSRLGAPRAAGRSGPLVSWSQPLRSWPHGEHLRHSTRLAARDALPAASPAAAGYRPCYRLSRVGEAWWRAQE